MLFPSRRFARAYLRAKPCEAREAATQLVRGRLGQSECVFVRGGGRSAEASSLDVSRDRRGRCAKRELGDGGGEHGRGALARPRAQRVRGRR